VRFAGNLSTVDGYVPQLSREWPPPSLPGGYEVGDTVHWRGVSQNFGNGDKLVHGGEGEVAGAAGSEPTNRLAVRFPGSGLPIDCMLSSLSRVWPIPVHIDARHLRGVGDLHVFNSMPPLAEWYPTPSPSRAARRAKSALLAAIAEFKQKQGGDALRGVLTAALDAMARGDEPSSPS
jgi:hypothetical protein